MPRGRPPLLLAAITVAILFAPSSAAASGADVVAGHLRYRKAPSGALISLDFTSGASDTTPGVGFDGRGIVKMSQDVNEAPIFDLTSSVLCVNAVGDGAVVVSEVTKNDSPDPLHQMVTHIVARVLDGGKSDAPDALSYVLAVNPTEPVLQFYCASPAAGGGFATEDGNVIVKDGAT